MLYRGQSIIITRSSKRKGHPTVGDMGYIGNAMLFPMLRLILCDAHFFKYKGDRKTRCPERKQFVLNIGMSRDNKLAAIKTGLPWREYYAEESIQLCPCWLTDNVLRPSFNSPYGVFRPMNGDRHRVVNRMYNRKFKVPLVQYQCPPIKNRKRSIDLMDMNEFMAWSQAMSFPTLGAALGELGGVLPEFSSLGTLRKITGVGLKNGVLGSLEFSSVQNNLDKVVQTVKLVNITRYILHEKMWANIDACKAGPLAKSIKAGDPNVRDQSIVSHILYMYLNVLTGRYGIPHQMRPLFEYFPSGTIAKYAQIKEEWEKADNRSSVALNRFLDKIFPQEYKLFK